MRRLAIVLHVYVHVYVCHGYPHILQRGILARFLGLHKRAAGSRCTATSSVAMKGRTSALSFLSRSGLKNPS